ncbi:hypothetical protein [Aureliella helgolandensis]|uniref:Uncharacterized protein n=1 Tax=Aureliella helgolandensis TaxID=2527968 RepID=A0A518G5J4_9BACT|nr:hypothetical protein [Aureliella helgolandensis]QDV23860.1 hypothetical protein Q31a_21670 [Aureliella helgolandensis]
MGRLFIVGAAIFLAVLLAVFCLRQSDVPLTPNDHQVISSQLTAWALGQQELRGNKQPLIDFSFFSDRNAVLTYENCDPPRDLARFSNNAKIRVLDREATRAEHQTRGFEDTVYITISCLERGRAKTVYTVSIMFAALGGEGYDFEITKDEDGLSYDGVQAWVA